MIGVLAVFRIVVRVVSVPDVILHRVAVNADVYCSVLHDQFFLGRVVQSLIARKKIRIPKPHNPPETFGGLFRQSLLV